MFLAMNLDVVLVVMLKSRWPMSAWRTQRGNELVGLGLGGDKTTITLTTTKLEK